VLEAPEGVERWSDEAVAYLYRVVQTTRAREVPINLGSDDCVRLWLNGELILDRAVARGLDTKDHSLILSLRSGVNHLMVKVANGNGQWAFQMVPWSKFPQPAIDAAIDRGVEYLLPLQYLDGSWGDRPEYGSGYTAFATYALLKCGLRRDHPAIRRAVAYLRAEPPQFTYSLACVILALAELGDPDHTARLEECLDELVSWQESSGRWAYPTHPAGHYLPSDISNSLFVALALRAAEKAGARVPPRAWHALMRGALECLSGKSEVTAFTGGRVDAAGFGYRPGHAPSGSMTTAGISVLAMCEQALGREIAVKYRQKSAMARRSALAWLDHNMTWGGNPGHNAHHYFHVYGIERVGSLLGLDILGGINWYWDGAEYLVGAQAEDGSWTATQAGKDPMVDTLLALLFLRRATAPTSGGSGAGGRVRETAEADAEVMLRATGEAPVAVWISGFSKDLLARLEWPGEEGRGLRIERVEFAVRHLELGGPEQIVRVCAGNPARPAGQHRFAAQHTFPSAGEWAVVARVHALAPPREEGFEPEPVVVASPELKLRVEAALDPETLRYPLDRERNRIVRGRVRVMASSHHGGGQKADRAIDGSYATRWHCALDDAEPWIRLTFSQRLKADRLLLTHARPRATHRAAPRPARVRVVLNRRKVLEVEMNADPMRKTELVFERTEKLSQLELRILGSRDRLVGSDAVGFSEIQILEGR